MTKQIDVKGLIPFMKDGWVAMEEDERWFWYDEMPFIEDEMWVFEGSSCASLGAFNITPVEDWTKSLIRIDESQNNLCTTDELEK